MLSVGNLLPLGRDSYETAYYVALLVMIPVTVSLIQNTGLNILYAMNKHRFRSAVYLCIAVLNVGLTFLWVERYGIIEHSHNNMYCLCDRQYTDY